MKAFKVFSAILAVIVLVHAVQIVFLAIRDCFSNTEEEVCYVDAVVGVDDNGQPMEIVDHCLVESVNYK